MFFKEAKDPGCQIYIARLKLRFVLGTVHAGQMKQEVRPGEACFQFVHIIQVIPKKFHIIDPAQMFNEVFTNETGGELAEKIQSFRSSRATLVLPDFEDDFTRLLYATYLSYLPQDSFGYSVEMKHDQRGWLAELIKSKPMGQIFVSKTKPGITRGNHWHHTKVEKFIVLQGQAVIKFRQIHGGDVIEVPVSGDELKIVDIPAGYTHSIVNVGETDVITLFWADELFDPQHPDTYFLEV